MHESTKEQLVEVLHEVRNAVPAFQAVSIPTGQLEEDADLLANALSLAVQDTALIIQRFGLMCATFRVLKAEHESRLRLIMAQAGIPKA